MDWAAWQPWVIGGLAAGLILWFVSRALFADTPKNGPRCLKCGHPFVPDQGMVCTECGWTAPTPQDLLRTRRHWGKAAAGLSIMLGAATVVRVAATGGNPLILAPNQLLTVILRFDPIGVGGAGPVSVELERRLLEAEDDDPLIRSLIDVVVAGDFSSPPGSDAWFQRYGPLANRLRDGFVSLDSEAGRLLSTLPPGVMIGTPAIWPSDQSVPATLEMKDRWPIGVEAIVELRWLGAEGSDPIERIGYRNLSSNRRRHEFLLPPTANWPARGEIEVSISTRPMADRVTEALRSGVAVETDDPRSDLPPDVTTRFRKKVIRPTSPPDSKLLAWIGDDATDTSVTAVFDQGLRRWPESRRPFAIRFDPRRLQREEFSGVLFGFEVDIIERPRTGEEIVRRRTRLWLPGGVETSANEDRSWGWTISEEDTEGLSGAFDLANRSDWVMRIRGVEALARRALTKVSQDPTSTVYDRWWSGTIERDLPRSTEGRRPFIRMWFHPEGVRLPSRSSKPPTSPAIPTL